MKRVVALLVIAAAAFGAAGCSPAGGPPARASIRVAAAADLNVALGEIMARFSARHPVDVSASYGSSGTFFSQLTSGAPFDLFLSADLEYPRRLAEAGLTLEPPFTYAVGRLVVWVPASSRLDVDNQGLHALVGAGARRVAIANPAHAPYGRAAIAAIGTAGLAEPLRPKLVFGENVAQAMQFAQSGAADAAIVARSLALAPAVRATGRSFEIPAADHPPIEQGGAILRSTSAADAARAFRDFLIGAEGRSLLQQYGFSPPVR